MLKGRKYFVISIYFLTFANVFQKGIVPHNNKLKQTNKNYEGKIDDKE